MDDCECLDYFHQYQNKHRINKQSQCGRKVASFSGKYGLQWDFCDDHSCQEHTEWADHVVHHVQDVLGSGGELDSEDEQYYSCYDGDDIYIQKDFFPLQFIFFTEHIFAVCPDQDELDGDVGAGVNDVVLTE